MGLISFLNRHKIPSAAVGGIVAFNPAILNEGAEKPAHVIDIRDQEGLDRPTILKDLNANHSSEAYGESELSFAAPLLNVSIDGKENSRPGKLEELFQKMIDAGKSKKQEFKGVPIGNGKQLRIDKTQKEKSKPGKIEKLIQGAFDGTKVKKIMLVS